MSLILKGIDMPKDGDFIALEIHKDEYRIYYTKGATIREKRGEAIQILKPHGRIIDASKVYCYNYWDETNLRSVPTILESEGEDDDK